MCDGWKLKRALMWKWGGRNIEGRGCGSRVDEGRGVVGCESGVSGSWRDGGGGGEAGGGRKEGGGGVRWVEAGEKEGEEVEHHLEDISGEVWMFWW